MTEPENNKLRVVLLADAGKENARLREVLERHYDVVTRDGYIDDSDRETLGAGNADVCLVELDSRMQQHLDMLARLVEQSQVPILFNVTHEDFGPQSEQALVAKLAHLATEAGDRNPVARPRPSLRVVDTTPVSDIAGGIWALGASLGGPRALKHFFQTLPADCAGNMLVMQHIPAGHEALFARQLAAVARRDVRVASDGMDIRRCPVTVVPVGYRFDIDSQGIVELEPRPQVAGSYQPSINEVFSVVARRYGKDAGGIIFSGMGEDGVEGMREIQEAGGMAWAQEAGSCAVSTMPDAARKAGTISFSGTPAQLAARLVELDREKRSAAT